jgi:hypothetical protein
MEHKHVTFYEHSAARSAVLGLEELARDGADGNSFAYNRSAMEKQADVIQYLKRLPSNVRATSVDIKRELNIDLEMEDYVLDMMKSNPKLDFEISKEGIISFQYRDKYIITNIMELQQTVERVKSGVLVSDIADCYEGIGAFRVIILLTLLCSFNSSFTQLSTSLAMESWNNRK